MGFQQFVEFITTHSDPEKEYHELIETFRAFDVRNKGFAPSADIREILLAVMEKCSDQDKKQILKVFRLDVDRNVSFEGKFSITALFCCDF